MIAELATALFHPDLGESECNGSREMNIVERLLLREEIDSLEFDLARAREARDSGAVSAISKRIAQLEVALTRRRHDSSATAARAGVSGRRG